MTQSYLPYADPSVEGFLQAVASFVLDTFDKKSLHHGKKSEGLAARLLGEFADPGFEPSFTGSSINCGCSTLKRIAIRTV